MDAYSISPMIYGDVYSKVGMIMSHGLFWTGSFFKTESVSLLKFTGIRKRGGGIVS